MEFLQSFPVMKDKRNKKSIKPKDEVPSLSANSKNLLKFDKIPEDLDMSIATDGTQSR